MKLLHELLILNDFYYCFLLAFKLRKCDLPSANDINQKIFLKRWLSSAQKKDYLINWSMMKFIGCLKTCRIRGQASRSSSTI